MFNRHVSALLPTAAFVLMWSSGAIVSKIGLRHGSPFALLILRYIVALVLMIGFAAWKRQLLPAAGSRGRAVVTGLLIAGIYTSCYLLTLHNGVTPGALATLLGVQPILTVFVTEGKVTLPRFLGLLCALAGLALVVWDGLMASRFSAPGLAFALIALLSISFGSILQKRETQAPWVVLPLQYAVGLAFIGLATPFAPFHVSWEPGFLLPVLWLALVISVGSTFLLYSLIARGNLVNVTSLFYLVPGVTAALDWTILGNPMSLLALAGLGLTMMGLVLVFRQGQPQSR